jgi:catechol 2,3-dioxygenase-like lactoylglutathione lyase family enzyme
MIHRFLFESRHSPLATSGAAPFGFKGAGFLFLSSLFLLCHPSLAKHKPPKRPRILGIAGITLFVSDIPEARKFYQQLIDPNHACNYCEEVPSQFLLLPTGQRIAFKRMPSPAPSNLLAEISFLSDDLDEFERFLHANKLGYDEIKKKHGGELISILLDDPEGHHLSITDSYHLANAEDINAGLPPANRPSPIRILHAGFVVKDLAAENHFYMDLLGFRLYWQGGFKDDGLDWYEIQVPDGDNWIEYMLNIPANADYKQLGIQNHFSLGVKDIHATAEQLRKSGLTKFDGPEIGRDGKWALDVYDPDGTRIEFMEFTPAREPCCHPYTAPHPKP